MHGKFFWYDIMTTDVTAAGKFYCDVAGWGLQDSGTPGEPYTLLTVEGRGVAGLMRIPEDAAKAGVAPAWMGYIAVDDVDQAAAALKSAGGSLHRGPIEVPGVIRFAAVSDPQGAGFLIARGLVKDGPPQFPPATPGTFGWRELYAGDWQSAFAFYQTLFGWTKAEAIDMGSMGTYQLFAIGGEPVGGMMNKPAMAPRPHWSYYINVADIDAAASKIIAGGGTIQNGPHQVPGGSWIVQAVDPQGAPFALAGTRKT
jgi:uncharacterized protein